MFSIPLASFNYPVVQQHKNLIPLSAAFLLDTFSGKGDLPQFHKVQQHASIQSRDAGDTRNDDDATISTMTFPAVTFQYVIFCTIILYSI
jgi:hypothetical protein